MSQSFDRVRSRTDVPAAAAPVDVQGKAALFSDAASTPSLGSVAISWLVCTMSGMDRKCGTVALILRLSPRLASARSIIGRDFPSCARTT